MRLDLSCQLIQTNILVPECSHQLLVATVAVLPHAEDELAITSLIRIAFVVVYIVGGDEAQLAAEHRPLVSSATQLLRPLQEQLGRDLW